MTAPAITRPAAGTKITITVTAEHIARGSRCQADYCPIALAVQDAMPGAGQADVYPGESAPATARVWTGPSSWIELRLGDDALTFMRHFDDGTGVAPATFEAEVA